MSEKLLSVQNLYVEFPSEAGVAKAINGISFDMEKGETLGIVGESGSGKSVTMQAVMRILSDNAVVRGKILYKGEDLLQKTEKEMQAFRGKTISMVFQDPMTSLNPVLTVGAQIVEAIELHTDLRGEAAKKRAMELLGLVGMNDTERRMKQYPHEMSGGRRQRAVIAMALACEPEILIADEPTTALDATVQAQILLLLKELQRKLGLAVILISHDLGIIANISDRVLVLYGGTVCEKGTADDIFYRPAHEYTKGLLRSVPGTETGNGKLVPIPGNPINVLHLPKGCPFAARCEKAMKICLLEQAPERTIAEGHTASCWMNEIPGIVAENNEPGEISGIHEDTGGKEAFRG